jgi:F-type H+-transporting ATPase subunit a
LIVAEFNLIEHLSDHPWDGFTVQWGGHEIMLMSSAIASMILVAIAMLVFVLPQVRRASDVPRGGRNVLEVLILFVRDWIAKPALHDRAYQFMPFLLTQFLFFLGMNLIGLIPLVAISEWATGGKYPVGATPTAILTVTGANAAMVFVMILYFGFREQAARFRHRHAAVPWVAAIALSPLLFIKSLVPPIPGIIGYIFWPLLLVIELASLVSRCAALMIRLFANMVAGHSMLAAFTMFMVVAGWSVSQYYVGPLSVFASIFVSLLELLVGVLQAFVFTFLTAIFVGLYTEPSH